MTFGAAFLATWRAIVTSRTLLSTMLLADVRPKQLADDGGPAWRLAIDKATFWQQVPIKE